MKLLYIAKEPWEEKYIKEKLPDVEIACTVGVLKDLPEDKDESVEAVSVFVNSPVGVSEMDRYPNLKLITTRSTGFDHIDLAEAKRRGITTVNVPAYGANTVAEFAFALILALSRRVCEAHARVAEGSFSQEGLVGFDLAGKTLGIVGGGKIGIHAATIAKGFAMDVLVYDMHHNDELAKRVGFSYVELSDLLKRSDIITLHVPYNKHTHHLINMANVGQVKRGAYLINTSRGAVVETGAIVEALRSGALAGAGLDVLEEEEDMRDEMHILDEPNPREEEMRVLLANHYLREHPRVIVTPHIAFNTKEAVQRIIDTTAENVEAFIRGAPQNVVRPPEA